LTGRRGTGKWQINAIAHTGHAFTNPNAQSTQQGQSTQQDLSPEQEMVFNRKTNDRAWASMELFMQEIFY
tara:strand:+ start:20755 stop:20964 length:210 start_codon:yes stop_codon:yes gene_type:complete